MLSDEVQSDVCSNISDLSYLSELEDECQSYNFDLSNGSPISLQNFNIAHYNINSITAENRLDQLSEICQTLNLSVLVITESKLDENIPTHLLTIPGYHEPVRRDRDYNGRNGGGVLVYIEENLIFQQKIDFQSPFYEHIWVDVKYKHITFAINALYWPPLETVASHTQFTDTCNTLLHKLTNYTATYKIITSDLNFGNCYSKCPILNYKPLDAIAPDIFSSYGFSQLIDIPTRITEESTSLLDLFFVDNLNDIDCHGTLPKIADHDGIVASFKLNLQKPKVKTKKVYDYLKVDIEGLIDFIKNVNFETTVFSQPINMQTNLFENILIDAFSKCVPIKTVHIRPNDQPWSNTYTRLLLRKKNRNYSLYKKAKSKYEILLSKGDTTPEILTRYLAKKCKAYDKSREAANNSNVANRRAKSAFFNSLNSTMNNCNISAKKKFGILLNLMKNNKFSGMSPLNENGLVYNDPREKGKILNDFFASKSKVNGFEEDPPSLEKFENVAFLSALNTSPLEVSKLVRNLKKSHISPCGISGKFLHLISKEISYPLSTLLNNLFQIGHFPDNWKIAHVTPIFKRVGSKNSKLNYRPISILPSLSKVCESIIHERLLSHCTHFKIITERQAAYLKGDSTITQLIYLIHQIRLSWGQSKIAHGLFLDISAAFDKVWHKGLLSKLEQIGVTGSFLDIFISYLSNRKQCVVIDGIKSDLVEIQAGVPQGSRLGPLLFLIYINDIVIGLENEILLFADDCSLLATGLDPNETAEKLNRDLVKISCWAQKWKVTFNAGKSKDVIFSNKFLNNSPPLVFNENFIDRVNTHRHLGVYLTSNLDWSVQINDVCLRANKKLSVLRHVKLLKRNTLDLLYKITVRSVIDYALPVYANNLRLTELARLDRIQYRAAKLVTGALHFTSRVKLNIELGWENFDTRIKFLCLSLFHKIHLFETRPLVRNCRSKIDYEKKYLTRSKGGYLPYPFYGDKFKRSFFPYVTSLWNNLDVSLQLLALPEFKSKLKDELKPHKFRHFSKGSKHGNKLLTRMRLERSDLNLHRFTIGQSETPECICHSKQESSQHFLLDCFLYSSERQALFDRVEHYIPKFKSFSKIQKYETLVMGINAKDPFFYSTNTTISIAVQTFIMKTKRFSEFK